MHQRAEMVNKKLLKPVFLAQYNDFLGTLSACLMGVINKDEVSVG
jgi:hypothetical protein